MHLPVSSTLGVPLHCQLWVPACCMPCWQSQLEWRILLASGGEAVMLTAAYGTVKPGFDCSLSQLQLLQVFMLLVCFISSWTSLFFQEFFGSSLIALMREDNHQLVVFRIVRFGQMPAQIFWGYSIYMRCPCSHSCLNCCSLGLFGRSGQCMNTLTLAWVSLISLCF